MYFCYAMNFKEINIGLETTFRGQVGGKDELH
jgi:hypothetical protein